MTPSSWTSVLSSTTSLDRYAELLPEVSLATLEWRSTECVCTNCVPGSRGPIPVPSVKMAICAHPLCLPIYSPASFLCRSSQRPALTRALYRWIGVRPTRDHRLKHLKLMLFMTSLAAAAGGCGCAFCARLSSSALRLSVAARASAAIGCSGEHTRRAALFHACASRSHECR